MPIIVMTGKRALKPTGGWVVDMRHYLDEDTGDLPSAIPERVLSLAIFFGAIVSWVTDHLPEGDEYTNVPCRRSPGRRRCRSEIIAQLDRTSGYIVLALSAVRGQRMDPRVGRHAVGSPARRGRRADESVADDHPLRALGATRNGTRRPMYPDNGGANGHLIRRADS
jgi:hypothetical protein